MSKQDTAVNEEVVADTTNTESAPVENESTVTADNALDDDAFDDIDDEVAQEAETEGEDEDEAVEATSGKSTEETEPQPQGEKPLSPKSENRFQQLANQKREYEQQLNDPQYLQERLAELNAQKAQVAQEQGLLNEINPETGDYYTPQEAERIAFAQSRAAKSRQLDEQSYALQVQQNQEVIGSEARQVMELPIFKEGTKEFKPELVAQYEDLLSENTLYQAQDGNTYTAKQLMQAGVDLTQATLVGANISPLKLAKLIADSTQANQAQLQAEAQRSTERMLANADVPAGSSNANPKDDTSDFDEAWDE